MLATPHVAARPRALAGALAPAAAPCAARARLQPVPGRRRLPLAVAAVANGEP
jgi:hypothetical protein